MTDEELEKIKHRADALHNTAGNFISWYEAKQVADDTRALLAEVKRLRELMKISEFWAGMKDRPRHGVDCCLGVTDAGTTDETICCYCHPEAATTGVCVMHGQTKRNPAPKRTTYKVDLDVSDPEGCFLWHIEGEIKPT